MRQARAVLFFIFGALVIGSVALASALGGRSWIPGAACGLNGPLSIAVSPDGSGMFIASWSEAGDVYTTGYTPLATFTTTDETGRVLNAFGPVVMGPGGAFVPGIQGSAVFAAGTHTITILLFNQWENGGTCTDTLAATFTTPQGLFEQASIHHPVHTFANYHNASGQGHDIATGQIVEVSCKVLDGTIKSVNPDGYWYRIASFPWSNGYYAPANTFMNGDPPAGPYTHNTDFAVPDCGTAPIQQTPTVTLAKGSPAPFGYRYAVSLSGFPANTLASVSCRDTVSPRGFFVFSMRTNATGAASVANQCYSGDGPDHWVVVNNAYTSNRVQWGAGGSISPPPAPPKPSTANHVWIVTLGDSYTAGNGAGANYDACHRSYNSYAWLYMNRLRAGGRSVDIWQSACSGDVTTDVPGQLSNLINNPNSPKHAADIIVMTVGGNDLSFTSIVETCLLPRTSYTPTSFVTCQSKLKDALDNIDNVVERTQSDLKVIARQEPNAQVVLLGYPLLTSPKCPGTPWSSAITTAQGAFDEAQSTMVFNLNRTEKTTRFHFVSIADVFKTHGPCAASSSQYVRGADINPYWASYHPNAAGNQAIATLLYGSGVQDW
jgi:lysophospholipase L1-like esterase